MRSAEEPPTAARDDLTCEDVITFLFEYLGSEITPERAAAFERHLALCPSCVAYLTTYRETIRLGREALRPADDRPDELAPELLRALLAARNCAGADSNPAG